MKISDLVLNAIMACPLDIHNGEELMPNYALFDFLSVKNIWAKVALARMKNTTVPKPNLHHAFPVSSLLGISVR